jgi:hypothetical protein
MTYERAIYVKHLREASSVCVRILQKNQVLKINNWSRVSYKNVQSTEEIALVGIVQNRLYGLKQSSCRLLVHVLSYLRVL